MDASCPTCAELTREKSAQAHDLRVAVRAAEIAAALAGVDVRKLRVAAAAEIAGEDARARVAAQDGSGEARRV